MGIRGPHDTPDPHMGYVSLGAVSVNDILNAAKSLYVNLPSAAEQIVYIVNDPALPQIVNSVKRLHELEVVEFGASSPQAKGVGLHRFVTPLKYYVKFRENPAIGYLTVAGLLFGLVYLGYSIGKR